DVKTGHHNGKRQYLGLVKVFIYTGIKSPSPSWGSYKKATQNCVAVSKFFRYELSGVLFTNRFYQ
ncbi:hypothetical protein JVW21_13465, partial [Vibrio cholerae O1]|uniref:hypothetical protein n=1 Tax=Vibrio cholerae TaxID=666 RepID=UPI001C122636